MCGYDFLLVKNDPWIWGQRVTKSHATLLTPQTGPSGHRLCILALKPQYNTLLVLFLFPFLWSYFFDVHTMLHKMLRKLRKMLRKLMDLFWLHFSILCKNRVQIQMSLIQNQNNLTKECPIISCDAVSLLKQMNWHFFYSIVFKRSWKIDIHALLEK